MILLTCDSTNNKKMNTKNDTLTFSNQLVNQKFGDFFIYPMRDNTIDSIWKDSSHHILLDNIIEDTDIPIKAKFLACEIFFKKDIFFMQRHTPEKVADIYAQALVNNYTGMANSWGLLYEQNDDGATGIAFLTIGEKAIPALVRLLEDERTHLKYQGSIEAAVGNSYKYRIKDFAAYYIGRIIGNPLKYYPTYEERDKQIQELKRKLENKAHNKG